MSLAGVIASMGTLSRPATGLLGAADFVSDIYTWGGVSLTAADVVDRTDWLGTSGLEVPSSASASAGAQLLGSFASYLAACQWTVVIDFELLATSDYTFLLTVDNAGEAYFIQTDYQGKWELIAANGTNEQFPFDLDTAQTTGWHKIAFTRTDEKAVICIDGNTIVSDALDATSCVLPVPDFPMVNVYLGGWDTTFVTSNAVNIRSLSIYSPQPDAALAALSAP